jgi:uncharacterized protein with WD repeat
MIVRYLRQGSAIIEKFMQSMIHLFDIDEIAKRSLTNTIQHMRPSPQLRYLIEYHHANYAHEYGGSCGDIVRSYAEDIAEVYHSTYHKYVRKRRRKSFQKYIHYEPSAYKVAVWHE